jgi:hypothetical protein
MPELDGIEAATRIREESGNDKEHPWIIGVSATLQETEIERAMEAGMNDFLGKPFFVRSLQEAIQASAVFSESPGSRSKPVPVVGNQEPNGETARDSEEEPSLSSSWQPPGDTNDIYRAGVLDDELIQQAIDEIPTLFADMKRGLNDEDFDLVQERAHYLKNTIFALKMDELFDPCRKVYDMAGHRRVEDALNALEDLHGAFDTWQTNRQNA